MLVKFTQAFSGGCHYHGKVSISTASGTEIAIGALWDARFTGSQT